MDGLARALEHFRGSGVRAVALVPEKWHRSGGIFPEFPNPRVMTEDAWAILDVLVREGSAELLPESDLSDGEALLYFALRNEFVGGVVTNDQLQFRAALERAQGGPAAPAAHLAFVHHLVRYAFEGAEMRFTTRVRSDSSDSSESPPPWASDFEGMRPGCDEIRAAAPWAARAASAGEARRRDARRDAESAAEAERVADEADWVDAMRAAEAAEREEAEAKVAADEAAARALQARLDPIDRERERDGERERGARGETRADGWQTATARRDKTRRDARRRSTK